VERFRPWRFFSLEFNPKNNIITGIVCCVDGYERSDISVYRLLFVITVEYD